MLNKIFKRFVNKHFYCSVLHQTVPFQLSHSWSRSSSSVVTQYILIQYKLVAYLAVIQFKEIIVFF
jgi:hypothetical protein